MTSWIWWRVIRPLMWHVAGLRERGQRSNLVVKTGKCPDKEDTVGKDKGANTGGPSGTGPGTKAGQGGTGPGRPGTAGGSGGTKGDEGNKGDGVKN